MVRAQEKETKNAPGQKWDGLGKRGEALTEKKRLSFKKGRRHSFHGGKGTNPTNTNKRVLNKNQPRKKQGVCSGRANKREERELQVAKSEGEASGGSQGSASQSSQENSSPRKK